MKNNPKEFMNGGVLLDQLTEFGKLYRNAKHKKDIRDDIIRVQDIVLRELMRILMRYADEYGVRADFGLLDDGKKESKDEDSN